MHIFLKILCAFLKTAHFLINFMRTFSGILCTIFVTPRKWLEIINSALHLLNNTTATFVPTEPKKMFANGY